MSNEPDRTDAEKIVAEVVADVRGPSAAERARTVLLTLGILGFGFGLGAHYLMHDVIITLPDETFAMYDLSQIQRAYHIAVKGGGVVAVAGLGGAIAIEEYVLGDSGETDE